MKTLSRLQTLSQSKSYLKTMQLFSNINNLNKLNNWTDTVLKCIRKIKLVYNYNEVFYISIYETINLRYNKRSGSTHLQLANYALHIIWMLGSQLTINKLDEDIFQASHCLSCY